MALRTGAFDKAIGEKQPLFRIEHLFDIMGSDMAGIAQAAIDLTAKVAIFVSVGRTIVVKVDAKFGEIRLVSRINSCDQRFWRNALLFRAKHNGRAVGIVGAHVVALVAAALLKAHPHVSLDVLKQVS